VCNAISCAADAEMIAARLVNKAGGECRIQSTFSGADRGKGAFSDAYPRFVSKDANAKP